MVRFGAVWCIGPAARRHDRADCGDKLGNRSNASSEIEYRETWARMVGEEGEGVRTIIEMVHHTRLDCVSDPRVGAAGS